MCEGDGGCRGRRATAMDPRAGGGRSAAWPGTGKAWQMRALALAGPRAALLSPAPTLRGAEPPWERSTGAPDGCSQFRSPGGVIRPLPHPHAGEGTKKGTGWYCAKSLASQRRGRGTSPWALPRPGRAPDPAGASWGSRAVLIRFQEAPSKLNLEHYISASTCKAGSAYMTQGTEHSPFTHGPSRGESWHGAFLQDWHQDTWARSQILLIEKCRGSRA